ncbi:MAG: hypothetical protein M3Y59_08515 [Myxococcota bacterium]|nr:hypothetical protein [Myxococcota bacterium]
MSESTSPARRSVRYEVRSEGGVMTYDTLLHVEQAYMAGWIAPEDEIRQEGETDWRKAGSLPQLAGLKKAESSFRGGYIPWVVAVLILSIAALVLWIKGSWQLALMVAILITFTLFKITRMVSRIRH